MNSLRNKRISPFKIIFWATNLILFYYLCQKGYELKPDSAGYIDNYIVRTPIYPIFLDLFHLIFAQKYLSLVSIFQIIFGFLSVYIFTNTLRNKFQINYILYYVIYFVSLYYVLIRANSIITEAVTYSLFLLMLSFFVKVLFNPGNKNIIMMIILSLLIVLTRPQFIFLYVFILLVLIFIYFNKNNYKQFVMSLFIFILLATAANLFQKGYNYFVHGYFTQIPFIGMQLLTTQLYISDPSDIALFEDQDQVKLLSEAYGDIEKENLSKKYSSTGNVCYHYEYSYNQILWGTIYPIYKREYSEKEMTVNNWIEFDKFSMKIAVILLKKNYRQYMNLIKDNLIAGGKRCYYYYILILFGVAFSLYSYLMIKDKIALFFLFSTCLNALNYILISLFQPIIPRYSFYTDVIQFVSLILLISSLMNKKMEKYNS